MSKTIDERVVSMQFDNKQFESNVKTTMSTLEKLKQSLNLKGASKGLEEVGSAARKCDISPLGTAVEGVKLKFSAMEVMAVTALSNITNSAVNAGKRIVESLTITPITTGFNEYELKMGAIQTIMASTGADLDTVNRYLEELNKYSDQTIYSFQDMTTNIGKFTNAGVSLEDAVIAIKGIANEAAVSGANANEAARAMYNFSQALSTGYIQRIDWKSIELANMATVEFKEQLLDMAKQMGTVEKNATGMYRVIGDDTWYNTSQMFIETLDEQWLTSEVLIETLKDYADETTDIGKKAKAAATEVKTFTMLMDTLKESAQSGWAQSWEIIVGDFDESKNLFTKLSDVIGGWINNMSDARNTLFRDVFDSKWTKFIKQINEAGISTEEFEEEVIRLANSNDKLKNTGFTMEELVEQFGSLEAVFKKFKLPASIVTKALKKFTNVSDKSVSSVEDMTEKLESLQTAFDKVWRGDYGNGAERFKALADAGYDYAEVQELVNKYSAGYKLTLDDLSDAQLENMGYTDEQIEKLRELQKQAEETGTPLHELIEDLTKPSGRELLLGSFKTLGQKIGEIFDAAKEGWNNIFGDSDIAGSIYNIVEKFAVWVDGIKIAKETLSDITSIVSGIFAAIQTGAILGGGLFGVINKIVQTATRFVGLDLISVLGDIGDALVKFRTFLVNDNALSNFLEMVGTKLAGGFEFVYGLIGKMADSIKKWFTDFLKLEEVGIILENLSTKISTAGSNIKEWIGGFGEIFTNVIDKIKSLDTITFDGVVEAIKTFVGDIIGHFASLGGIFTPLIGSAKDLFEVFLGYTGTTGIFKDLVEWIKKAYKAYVDWCDGLEGSEDLPKRVGEAIGNGLYKVLSSIGAVIAGLIKGIVSAITGIPLQASDEVSAGAENLGLNIIKGIITGLANGIRFVIEAIVNVGLSLIKSFANTIDSHSPSRVFMAFGGFIIAGLVIGILSNIPAIGEALGKVGAYISENFGSIISTIGDKIRGFFQNIDLSKISAAFWAVSSFIPSANILNIIAAISNFASSVGVTISTGFKTATDATKTAATKFGEALVKVFDVIKKVLSGIFTFIRDNFGSIVALISGFMLVQIITKLADVVLKLTTVVSKISNAISGMFSSIGKSFELVGKGVFILLLAFAIKELATAFVALADLSWEQIGRGAAVIGGLSILMTGLAIAIGIFAKKTKAFDAASIAGIGIVMLALAASVGILAYSLTLMDQVDDKRIWKHLGVIGALAAGMAIIGVIMSKVKGEITTGSLAMIAISAAILILVFALTKLNALTITDPQKTITALVALAGGLALVALMSKGISSGAAVGLIGLVLSIFLFTKLLERLAKSEDAIMSGLGTVILILGMFAGLMLATRLISWDSGNDMAKVCSGILMLSLALILVVGAMRMLNKLDASGVAKGLIVVSVVMALFVAIIAVSKLAGEHAMRAGVMLTMMATSMLILVGAIWLLALIGRDNMRGLEAATAVVVMIMGMFTVLIHASQYAQKSMGAIIALTVAISAIVVAIGILTLLAKDPASLWQAVAAMTIIISILSLLMYSVKFISSGGGTFKTIGTMVALVGLILILSDVVKHIAEIPSENALGAVAALATLLVSMAAVCIAAAFIGKFKDTDLTSGMLALYALIPFVFIVGEIIRNLHDIDTQQALGMVTSLSAMILAMSIVCVACGLIGKVGPKALLGVVVLDAVIVSLLAVILSVGALINSTDWAGPAINTFVETMKSMISGFSEVADGLVLMLTSLMVVTGVCAAIGTLGPTALWGVAVLDAVIISLLGIMLGLGALIDKTKWAGPALDAAIEFIKKLCTGLGEALGGFVSGVGTGLTSGLSQMGDDLEAFSEKIEPFITSMKGLSGDTSALDGARALVEMISSLAGANIKTSLSSMFSGESNLENITSQLVPFGNAMVAFSNSISGKIDADAVEAAAKAGSMMADLQASLPKTGGKWQEWFGETDFTAFTAQLVPFGHAMVAFSSIVAGKIDTDAVQAAADAGAIMSELQNGLPKEYGKISGLFASSPIPLDTFGGQLVHFGRAMIMFSDIVSNGEINQTAIQAASDAAKIMTALANELPKEHGTIKSWFTDNTISLDTFGSQLVLFGRAIISFSRIVSNGIDQTAVEAAATAGMTMSTLAKSLPEETGWLKSWFSDNTMSMSDFGKELVKFGEAVVDFSDTISGNIDLTAITTASDAASGITDVLMKMPQSVHIESFKTSIKEFGTAMVEFSEAIKGGIDPISLSVVTAAAQRLAEAAAIMPDSVNLALLTNGLTEYGEAIKTFSNQMKDGAVDLDAVDIATKAGKSIADMVAAIPPDVDYAGFATNIAGIGKCLVNFSNSVSEGSINTIAIETATVVGTKIGDMLASLVGFTDITDFIDNAKRLGESLAGFSDAVDDDAVSLIAVENAATAGTKIGMMMTAFGVWKDMTDFINNAALLAQAIVDFSTKVKDNVDPAAVGIAATAGTQIGALTESLSGWKDPSTAISQMGNLSTAIVNFSATVAGKVKAGSIEKATEAGSKIATLMKELPVYSDLSTAIACMNELATSLVNFVKMVGGLDFSTTSMTMIGFKAMVLSFSDIATQAVDGFVETMSSSKSKMNTAINSFAKNAASKIKTYYTKFYDAGKYLVQGFAHGIKTNSYIATAAAAYVSNAAMQVAKDILGINSPSKVFIGIGKSIPEGFAMGIGMLGNVVDDSVVSMASSALRGTKNIIAKLADYVETDIDSQPTIRPVLDLSDVTSGARQLDGMFNMTPSVGVLSNLGSISSMMNRNQNGTNDDVISAIKDLGNALSKSGGDTYQINGITCDDDSSVAEAIRTITRAAKMERRV